MLRVNMDLVFEDIRDYVQLVLEKTANGLIVTGDPGVGKTWTVTKKIAEMASLLPETDPMHHYCVVKVKMSTLGLYRKLYENNGKLLLFDDVDDIWNSESSANVLKAALDTTGERILSYDVQGSFNPAMYSRYEQKALLTKGKLPSPFKFTGRIIFISNLFMHQLDSAVVDRCLTVELNLSKDEIFSLIELRKHEVEIPGNPTEKDRDEVVKLMKLYFAKQNKKPSLRLFRTCAMLYSQALCQGKDKACAERRVLTQISS